MSETPYTNDELAALGNDAFPKRGTYCPRCRNFIPKFAAIGADEEARLRIDGIAGWKALRVKTGCNMLFAKIWWIHPNGAHAAKVTPPCPYCGEPLFTENSKQCLKCGWDWHDSKHLVKHVVKSMPNKPARAQRP